MGSSAPSWNGLNEGEELHVLAVDDSIIDRKCIEKLLKSFAYKGIYSFTLLSCMASGALSISMWV